MSYKSNKLAVAYLGTYLLIIHTTVVELKNVTDVCKYVQILFLNYMQIKFKFLVLYIYIIIVEQ